MSHTSTRTDKRIERWEWQITAGRRRWREALLALDARKIDPRPAKFLRRIPFYQVDAMDFDGAGRPLSLFNIRATVLLARPH